MAWAEWNTIWWNQKQFLDKKNNIVTAGKIDPVKVETRNVSEVNRTLQEMKEGKILGLVALTHK